MELSAFLVMAFGAYATLLTRNRRGVLSCFAVYVIYSIIIRSAPPTSDMVVYYEAAASLPSWRFYYLREPVVWFGSAFLYGFTQHIAVTFVIIDIVAGLLVLWAMQKIDDGDGRMFALAPTIFSSYIFVLGQQNIFRQHIALVLVLCSLALRSKSVIASFAVFIGAFLTHNVTAVLGGLWLDSGHRSGIRKGPLLSAAAVGMLVIAGPLIGKSATDTGIDTRHLYFAISAALAVLLLYANVGFLGIFDWRSAALTNFVAFAPAILVLSASQFERSAMLFYLLIIIGFYRNASALRVSETTVAHLAYFLLVVPVFLFDSVLGKLL